MCTKLMQTIKVGVWKEGGGTRINLFPYVLPFRQSLQRRALEENLLFRSAKSVHLYKANVPWFLAVCKVSFFR